jgi:hypothetical protein
MDTAAAGRECSGAGPEITGSMSAAASRVGFFRTFHLVSGCSCWCNTCPSAKPRASKRKATNAKDRLSF